ALELRDAPVAEPDPRAGDEILHGVRDEHFARRGLLRDSRADVNGNSTDLSVHHLAFPRVQACANLEAEVPDGGGDRARAADRPRGPVEAGEEAIPGCIQLVPLKALELAPDQWVVLSEQLPPGCLSEADGL